MKTKREKYIAVLMTCAGKGEARKIAQALLRTRQAACVGIFPKGESLFWWEGRIDRAEEFLLIAKTTRARLGGLTGAVKKLHSYQVPEIIALPIVGGNPDYLKWLGEEVKNSIVKR